MCLREILLPVIRSVFAAGRTPPLSTAASSPPPPALHITASAASLPALRCLLASPSASPRLTSPLLPRLPRRLATCSHLQASPHFAASPQRHNATTPQRHNATTPRLLSPHLAASPRLLPRLPHRLATCSHLLAVPARLTSPPRHAPTPPRRPNATTPRLAATPPLASPASLPRPAPASSHRLLASPLLAFASPSCFRASPPRLHASPMHHPSYTTPIPLLYPSYPRLLASSSPLLLASSPCLLASPPRLAPSSRCFLTSPSPSERPEEVSKYTDSNSIVSLRGESPPRADTRLTSLSQSNYMYSTSCAASARLDPRTSPDLACHGARVCSRLAFRGSCEGASRLVRLGSRASLFESPSRLGSLTRGGVVLLEIERVCSSELEYMYTLRV